MAVERVEARVALALVEDEEEAEERGGDSDRRPGELRQILALGLRLVGVHQTEHVTNFVRGASPILNRSLVAF